MKIIIRSNERLTGIKIEKYQPFEVKMKTKKVNMKLSEYQELAVQYKDIFEPLLKSHVHNDPITLDELLYHNFVAINGDFYNFDNLVVNVADNLIFSLPIDKDNVRIKKRILYHNCLIILQNYGSKTTYCHLYNYKFKIVIPASHTIEQKGFLTLSQAFCAALECADEYLLLAQKVGTHFYKDVQRKHEFTITVYPHLNPVGELGYFGFTTIINSAKCYDVPFTGSGICYYSSHEALEKALGFIDEYLKEVDKIDAAEEADSTVVEAEIVEDDNDEDEYENVQDSHTFDDPYWDDVD